MDGSSRFSDSQPSRGFTRGETWPAPRNSAAKAAARHICRQGDGVINPPSAASVGTTRPPGQAVGTGRWLAGIPVRRDPGSPLTALGRVRTRGPAAKTDQLSVDISSLAMDNSRLAVYMSRLSVYIRRLSVYITRLSEAPAVRPSTAAICPWTSARCPWT